MAGPSQGERERTLELINEEFNRRIDQQTATGAAIDTKSTLVVGFVVVGVQVFLGQSRSQPWSTLAFVAFFAAFLAGVGAIALRKYDTVPNPPVVMAYLNANLTNGPTNLREHVLALLAGTKVTAVQRNTAKDTRKSQFWWTTVVALGLAIVFSLVSVLEASGGSGQSRQCGHDAHGIPARGRTSGASHSGSDRRAERGMARHRDEGC